MRLLASVLAAATTLWSGTFRIHGNEVEPAAAAAIILFAIALLSEVALLRPSRQEAWYGGRRLAERTKTLAWRYAVGADLEPHAIHTDELDPAAPLLMDLDAECGPAHGDAVLCLNAPLDELDDLDLTDAHSVVSHLELHHDIPESATG